MSMASEVSWGVSAADNGVFPENSEHFFSMRKS